MIPPLAIAQTRIGSIEWRIRYAREGISVCMQDTEHHWMFWLRPMREAE